MKLPPALGSSSRIPQRRRERSSICAGPPQETVTETRLHGVPVGGRPTLEQLLEGVWEGLHAGGTAGCPVCHGQMSRSAAGAGARCDSCGTEIA